MSMMMRVVIRVSLGSELLGKQHWAELVSAVEEMYKHDHLREGVKTEREQMSSGNLKNANGYTIKEAFRHFAKRIAKAVGTPTAFLGSIVLIVLWGASGPVFHYSDTWQLVINTATTIITFLMVFLIQNTHNRDSKAIHLKLDELIKAARGARNSIIDLDSLTDDQLKRLETSTKSWAAPLTGKRGGDIYRHSQLAT
jgi:low affinity Fe/Cu permease